MKTSIYYCMLMSLTMMITSVSCNESDGPNESGEKPAEYSIKLSARQKQALNQSNDFAFDVLKAVNNENNNVLVSPYSLGQALAMLANGAVGETYDEISRALKIGDDVTLDDINSYYAIMNTALTNSIKCSSKLAIANSLWLNKQYEGKILEEYKIGMRSNFNAKVSALDFSESKSVDAINNWSKEKTNGLIPNITKGLDPKTDVAILLNTLFFKGFWSYFPKKNTYNDIFRNQFDRNESVKMMKSDKCKLYGFSSDNELMVEFDYSGNAFQLLVIMPKKEKINSYIANLNGDRYNQLLTQIVANESEVTMPKFKGSYNNQLIAPLAKIGIKKAFSDDAQFGKISSSLGVCVTAVQQYTTIEVNEDGTTAVASTKVDLGFTSTGQLPKQFIIDHPFIYIIRERTTGVILFIGKTQSLEGMQ